MTNNDNTAKSKRRLVIRASRESLSFSTTEGNEVVFVSYPLNVSISIAANMREALRTEPLLAESYDRVLVLVDTAVLMVPVSIFREEDQEALYRHAFTGQEQQVVMHSVLSELNSVAVFSVNKDFRTVIADAFSHVRFMPVATPVWLHMHQRSYTGPRSKLFGYFHDKRMEVFCFAQNRFKFCNSFAVNNANDALYYLLYVWKQLSLDARHDELYLAGDTPDEEALMEEVQKFVKRVFHIYPSGEFNRSPVTQIDGMPYDLMALYMHKV